MTHESQNQDDNRGSLPSDNLPVNLAPALSTDLQSAVFSIGDAIGAALSLTESYGSYSEAGEPLDADAETETLVLKARENLELLADTMEGWPQMAVKFAFEAYKEHLYYDASAGFEYHGIDEQEMGSNLEGRFEGAYGLATKIVPDLDKATLIDEGNKNLVREIQEGIPALRAASSDADGLSSTQAVRATPGEHQSDRKVLEAIDSLMEKEEVLDLLLYHLENPDHAASFNQITPAPAAPPNYALILYHQDQDPEKDAGATLHATATETAARLRKEDLESGARLGMMLPPQKEIDEGTLVVEKIEASRP